MRCLTWRQHRGQLLWSALAVLAIAAYMVVVGRSAHSWLAGYHRWQAALRAAGCPVGEPKSGRAVNGSVPAACHTLLARYPDGAQSAFVHHYNLAIVVFEEGVPLLLVIVGVLLGAPLVAREMEQRTHLVAWTQSVSRRRWFVTKVVLLAGALAVLGLAAGIANDRLQIPLTSGGLTLSRWPWFFSIDLAPAAEAVLAFALAVALGAWFGRTIAAIGAGLVGFLVLFLLTAFVIRSMTPLDTASGPRGLPDDGWLISGNQYHSAGQWWPLQVGYLVLLVAVAAVVTAIGWRVTRTRAG